MAKKGLKRNYSYQGYSEGDTVILGKFKKGSDQKEFWEFYRTKITSCNGLVYYVCSGDVGSVIDIEGPEEVEVETKEGRVRTIRSSLILSPLETYKVLQNGDSIRELSDTTEL